MATNPFEEFGGVILEQKQVDDFAEFGGKVLPPAAPAQPTEDYAEFGGAVIPPPPEDLYTKLQKEKENYGLFNSLSPKAMEQRGGILTSRGVSDEEVRAYATHYGLDFDLARKLATLRGAVPPLSEIDSVSELIQSAAGKLNIATGNLAGWLGKKGLTDDPKVRAFLDDIGELGDGRAGLAETAIGLAVPGIGLGKAAKATTALGKAAGVAASTAGTGALYGVAGSKENEEIKGAVTGAILGVGLGAAGAGAVKLFTRKGRLPEADPETLKNITDSVSQYETTTGLDLVQETAKAYTPVKKSHDEMRDAFIEGKPLSDEAVDNILSQQVSPDTKEVIKKDLGDKYILSLPKEEQDAVRAALNEGNIPPRFGEAVSDRAIAEEVTRLRKDEFVDEIAARYPELRFVKAEGQAPQLRASNDEILQTARRSGDINLKREYDTWTAGQLAKEVLTEANVKIDPNTDVLGKYIINFATDRMFGFKVMGEKYGSDILQDFYQVNTNYNFFTAFKQTAMREMTNIYRTAKKYGLHKPKQMEDIYTKLDQGRYAELSPQQKEIADSMKSFFDKQREFFNSAKGEGYSPMNIPYREDFIAPQMLVRPVEYVIRMRQRLGQLEEQIPNLRQMSTEEFMRQTNINPALKEFKAGMEIVTDLPITNGRQMITAFNDATMRSGGNPRLYKLASTTLPRKEAIPDFLREKNLFKLMSGYVEGTGRTFYLREPLSRMAEKAKQLRTIGAEEEAKYVERFIQDNLGIRQYSMARIGNQARIAFAENAEKTLQRFISDPERRETIVNALRYLPEIAANVQYNIYPNVLALNPRAHFAQLTQVLFKTAPEIGGTYGYQLAAKSMLKALVNLATPSGMREFYGKVKELGLEPSGYVREAREGLTEGLEAALGNSFPAKVIRNLADAFMWTYGKMDTMNRAITVDISEQIVRDLRSGNRAALKAVKRMPVSVRQELVANKDNPTKQFQIVATHLNAATQFNYNRASMSELGVVLGPLFSTFTKWPLAISGDILADLRTKGAFKGGIAALEKYGAIFALATAMDSITHAILTEEDVSLNPDLKQLSDRARMIVGAGGFKSMTPITSLAAFSPERTRGEKNLFTPAIVDGLWNGVVSPILDGDTEQLAKGGMKLTETFFPGAFLNRIFMKVVPTVFGDGSKPESFEESLQYYGLDQ